MKHVMMKMFGIYCLISYPFFAALDGPRYAWREWKFAFHWTDVPPWEEV